MEYYGWIYLSTFKSEPFSLSREDENREEEEIKQKVQAEIDRINQGYDKIYGLYEKSASCCLSVMGIEKRKRDYFEPDILGFYHFIAKEAPGSYGLLYYRDDGDEKSLHGDLFRVLVLAKGKVTERFDPFLSPYFPTIED